MQVISGKYKKYKILTLPGSNTRPMSARVKESAFNILNNYFIYENKVACDIFSGSGQLGIEALSRGVKYVYFNDWHKPACDIIQQNINNLKIKNYELFQLEYNHFLNTLHNKKIKIDLFFLDPPFKEHEYYKIIIHEIMKNNILSNYGIIICESEFEINIKIQDLKLIKHKKFKNKFLYLFRRENE